MSNTLVNTDKIVDVGRKPDFDFDHKISEQKEQRYDGIIRMRDD